MSLEQKVMNDLKAAMIAKDKNALDSLRAIKSAIILAKTAEGASGELKEEDEIKMLQKLVKQRRDALEIYEKQNRADLAEKERQELSIIEKYLPQQLSAEEVRSEVKTIISESGASSPADMGRVIGLANKKLAGRAEGKVIAQAVKDLLAVS
jgi:uncharacterized protein